MTTFNSTEGNVLAQKPAICSSSENNVPALKVAICNSEAQKQCSRSTGSFLSIVRLTHCYCFQHVPCLGGEIYWLWYSGLCELFMHW